MPEQPFIYAEAKILLDDINAATSYEAKLFVAKDFIENLINKIRLEYIQSMRQAIMSPLEKN